jgi:hypothetical protein
MTRANWHEWSVADLVAQFTKVSLEEFEAELESDIRKQNVCVREAMAIAEELKRRPGDQRSALMSLYTHPNVQVQLNAARLSLAVAPAAAREVISAISESKKYPQAGDAGMCLWTLDQGIFVPT